LSATTADMRGGVDDDVRGYLADGFGECREISEITAIVGAVEFKGDDFTERGEAALQFPADLSAFTEEEDFHGVFLFPVILFRWG